MLRRNIKSIAQALGRYCIWSNSGSFRVFEIFEYQLVLWASSLSVMNPAEACFSARFLKRRPELDVNAGQHSCSSKRKRLRFVVATGSPAAIKMLRFEVATGTSREKRLHCFVLATGYPAAGIVSRATSFGLLPESSGFLAVLIVAQYKPFVPYPSNPRALFSREFFRRIPVVSGGCFARARLLPESSGFLAVLIVAQYKLKFQINQIAYAEPAHRALMHFMCDPVPLLRAAFVSKIFKMYAT
ncbi:histone methyltransferase [Dorcoceras hygrometricum]|uniref:Histone methyltransferase n=1 Tax=Dorcoceras hygrometricum TaxID=472368 RepID=A0A2Z7ASJ9_9LAMI|nr:histone methyltransferase [Dorcoceras hygrometricum]